MIVRVPNNLDVKEMVSKLGLSKVKSKNLKTKIYYFISRLVMTHQNVETFDEGFIRICTSEIKAIFNRNRKLAMDLLIEEGVIKKSVDYSLGGKCNKYKLDKRYQESELRFVTLKYKYSIKTEDRRTILDSFFNNHLKLNGVSGTVQDIVRGIIPLIKSDEESKVFKNKLGIWIQTINDVNQNTTWYKRSNTNYRYNSSITNLPRVFRNNLKYKGEQLVQVDIRSSQIYLLATSLNYDFFKSCSDKSFSKYLNDQNRNKEEVISYLFSPLMWVHFSKSKKDGFIEELTNLLIQRPKDHYEYQKFRDAPFSGDFYSHLFELEFNHQPNPLQRNSIKNDIMYVLFEGNRNHRKRVEGVRLINKYYPFVNKTIEYLIDAIGGRDFAILLQRIESHLVIDQVVPRFHMECPRAPIFTIHDSIITDEKHSLKLETIMRETLLRETQIEPGLKVEKLIPRPLMEKDVEDIYEKIKKKSTKRKFKKIEWSLLDRNIEHAETFISNYIHENHE
jgi:hypothetical protein